MVTPTGNAAETSRRALLKISEATILTTVDGLDLRGHAKISAVVGIPLTECGHVAAGLVEFVLLLRHTFAVRALEASPKGRQQVGRHLLALATYMGHVNIDATYWYLEATPELLRDIARAAEKFIRGGQQ